MKKVINVNDPFPKCYGIAYLDVWLHKFVCYPIPIHFLIGTARRFWHWFLMFRPSVKDIWLDKNQERMEREAQALANVKLREEVEKRAHELCYRWINASDEKKIDNEKLKNSNVCNCGKHVLTRYL